jgi:hypothetical protein
LLSIFSVAAYAGNGSCNCQASSQGNNLNVVRVQNNTFSYIVPAGSTITWGVTISLSLQPNGTTAYASGTGFVNNLSDPANSYGVGYPSSGYFTNSKSGSYYQSSTSIVPLACTSELGILTGGYAYTSVAIGW